MKNFAFSDRVVSSSKKANCQNPQPLPNSNIMCIWYYHPATYAPSNCPLIHPSKGFRQRANLSCWAHLSLDSKQLSRYDATKLTPALAQICIGNMVKLDAQFLLASRFPSRVVIGLNLKIDTHVHITMFMTNI